MTSYLLGDQFLMTGCELYAPTIGALTIPLAGQSLDTECELSGGDARIRQFVGGGISTSCALSGGSASISMAQSQAGIATTCTLDAYIFSPDPPPADIPITSATAITAVDIMETH